MKKIIAIFLGLTLVLSSIVVSSAASADSYKVEDSNGNTININIEPKAMGKITKQEAIQIANENPNAGSITIQEVGYPLNMAPNMVQRSLIIGVLETKKSYTEKNAFNSDVFVDSCARGETKTLKTAKSAKVEASVSGSLSAKDLGITAVLKYTIGVGRKLEGPKSSAKENTREFRCKFYVNKGKYQQFLVGDLMHKPVNSGTFKEPSKYVSYSVDKIVK